MKIHVNIMIKYFNNRCLPVKISCIFSVYRETEKTQLFAESARIKEKHVGNKVYFRGLIEFSNVCLKNCLYCGIRHDNNHVHRYNLTDDEIIDAARFAADNNYGSLVLQSGEIQHDSFTGRMEKLLTAIHQATAGKLRITLSCGEQSAETYKLWHDSGAHRYLLRIESSNPELYKKLHPNDENHSFQRRLDSLYQSSANRLPGWYRGNDRIAISNPR